MSRNPRARFAVRAGAAALLALALVAVARADLLFLKDGFVIQGQVKRDFVLEIDKGDAVEIPRGPFYLVDGPRKICFSPTQIRLVEKRDFLANEERLNAARSFGVPGIPVSPIQEVLAVRPFDTKWERTVQYRGPKGAREEPQHLGFITPYWARVDAMKTCTWSACYLTREFTADELTSIVSNHADIVERPGMAEAEVVRRRLRLVDFLTQTSHFVNAEKQLRGIAIDFPGQAANVDAALARLNRIRGRDRYEDIKRMHVAGQYKAAYGMLLAFPKDGASEQVLADVNDLKGDYTAAAAKLADVDRLLAALSKESYDPKAQRVLSDAAAAIRADLQPDALARLDVFLSQAKQYERQKSAGKTPDLAPADLLSLAVTGWLLGGSSAEAKSSTAVRLWTTRQMAAAYLKEEDVVKRAGLLSAFQREHNSQRFDEVLQILPSLPPPEAETNLDTVNPTEQQAGGRGGPTYLVQLPPEYRHGRSYPVLVVLHEANEKPLTMLRRWTDIAAEYGYILVAPAWQAGLGAYNYSEREHASVLMALRDLRRKYNVDSDRVFLFGLGQGGAMAFDVGLSHPDQFAGVVPMAAYPELFAEKYFRNAQYLPFYVVSGTVGGVNGYDANKKLKPYFEEWNLRGYPALWVEYKGRGTEWFGGELPNIMDWMRTKRRAFPLHQLGTDGFGGRNGNEFSTSRVSDNRFYWIETNGIDARYLNSVSGWKDRTSTAMLHARIDPNNNFIRVTAHGVRQVTLWLGRNSRGEGMINFDKPVTVNVNDKVMWANKPIEPKLETLLEDVYQRGDRQRPYLARIDLNW